MNAQEQNQNSPLDQVEEEQGDVVASALDFLTLIGENKIFIAKIVAPIAILAIIVSLLLTPVFTAKTLFIVPTPIQGGSAAQLMGNLGGIMGGSGGVSSILSGGKSPDEMYLEFLKTKLIQDELIKKYDLQKRYEAKSLEQAEKALKARTKLTSLKKAGLISIEVEDKDPQFAADLANAYVTQLKVLMESMALSESAQRKEYYKRELIRAKKELDGVTDYRDMKVRESVLAVIINQLEVATLDSARETLIQVAEVAVAPEKRSSPKRSLIVLISALSGLMVSIIYVLARQALDRVSQDPQNRSHWEMFKNAWKWRGPSFRD